MPIPHENDAYIMTLLFPHSTKSEISKLNKIRLHMKRLFLSDITDFRGIHILPDIRKGHTYQIYSHNFPTQSYSQKWLSLWNKACNTLQTHLSRNKLGPWYQRKFSCEATISTCRLWLQHNDDMYYIESLQSPFLPTAPRQNFIGREFITQKTILMRFNHMSF